MRSWCRCACRWRNAARDRKLKGKATGEEDAGSSDEDEDGGGARGESFAVQPADLEGYRKRRRASLEDRWEMFCRCDRCRACTWKVTMCVFCSVFLLLSDLELPRISTHEAACAVHSNELVCANRQFSLVRVTESADAVFLAMLRKRRRVSRPAESSIHCCLWRGPEQDADTLVEG